MIFYFSGTGNSKGIAEMLAERTGDTAADIMVSDPSEYTFGEDEKVGFVFPVYAYAAPAAMLAFAQKVHAGEAYTYAIPTYSNAAGCTLEHFSETACRLSGGFGIKMPDNMAVFDKIVEDRESAVQKLKEAAVRFEEIVQKVSNSEKGFDILYGPDAETLTWEKGTSYLKESKFTTEPYHVTADRCINCGLCERVCPAHVIKMENGFPVWQNKYCFMCMACFNRCPTEAIEYGQYSEGKYRYIFKGFDESAY